MAYSAVGAFFWFHFLCEKSFMLVFLSPPCCTAMPQPEVTGFVVLTL